MSETIGQQLGAARESLKLTIEDVAHKTRIHRDVLLQLEADEYDKLPNLMFAKSFIKLYSEHVAVDASLAISQLTAASESKEKQYLLGGINPRIRENFGRLTSQIPVRPILATAAVLACLAIGGSYLVTHLYGSDEENPEPVLAGVQRPETSVDVVDATPREETAPVINPDEVLIPKTVPLAPDGTIISEQTSSDSGPIPRAIPKAEPIDEEELEGEGETAASDEPYEPFVVTPGVVVNED